MPIQTDTGGEVLLTPKQVESLASLKGKALFNRYVELGVIGEGAEFVPGKGDEWSYIPAGPASLPTTEQAGKTVYDMDKIVGNPEYEKIFSEEVQNGAKILTQWKAYKAQQTGQESLQDAAMASIAQYFASPKGVATPGGGAEGMGLERAINQEGIHSTEEWTEILNLSYRLVGNKLEPFDSEGRWLTDKDIVALKWNALTDVDKASVAQTYATDPYTKTLVGEIYAELQSIRGFVASPLR